jgi:hypothetical protein
MNSCMRSLSEDAPIKQTWLATGNVHREFPVSLAHACVQYVRQNIREDMEDALGYLSMDLKRFYVQHTQGEVKDSDGQVKHRSDLDELLGTSTTSMDFDVSSVEG